MLSRAFKANPGLHFEVFIHKVDSLSDDTRMETQRDIHQRVQDELQVKSKINLLTYSLLLDLRSNDVEFVGGAQK